MKPRLRWKREERERGLRGVCQGERGYILMYGNQRVGEASVLYSGWTRNVAGYYYCCRWNGEYVNTCDSPTATIESAKDEAMAWAKKQISSVTAKEPK